ncbi:MAG TPA: adenylate/guanylate cyclase domain-containing protein [Anaerolineae bacterium]|nr:adenylate/guanylate cyclase domain-containing protein [Anaerolineae bacterium]
MSKVNGDHAEILIVDDTVDNLKLLRDILSQHGYKVRVAYNGALALHSAQLSPPDLILLDINMPDMDGYEVCRRLQAVPSLADIPIVFVSALGDVDNKVEAFRVGGVDYLTKPFQVEEVLVRVRTHLALRERTNRLSRSLQDMAQLLMAAQALSRGQSLEQITLQLLQHGGQLMGAEQMVLTLLEVKRETIVYQESYGKEILGEWRVDYETAWSGLVGEAMRTQRPLLLAGDDLPYPEVGGVVVMPLRAQEKVIGALMGVRGEGKRPFGQHDLDLVLTLATQAATTIENVRLQEQASKLLLNILPEPVAKRLQAGEERIADSYEEVTVLFADLVNFTPFAARLNPDALIVLLNDIFSRFDHLALQYGVEKIKTNGDNYMVVSGVPAPRADHAAAAAGMALAMVEALADFNEANQTDVDLRIGIHTGPVVAGIIGVTKFSYDLWGDTVNVASRMESQGEAGAIQISAVVYEHIKNAFVCQQRPPIDIKGKGSMVTYFLLDRIIE